jgi:putative tryptophan/tyrosine transport system substrate-binding protein
MRRRKFFLTSLAWSVAAPLTALAQQATKHSVGILTLGSAASISLYVDALRAGLRERGYTERDTVTIEVRSADNHAERLPALVKELVALKVKVIVTTGTTAVRAASDTAKTTPVVSAATADPVLMGFAQSLARPGGNFTGLSILGPDEILQKRLELLHQAAPQAKIVAFLVQAANPGNPIFVKSMTKTASSLGLRLSVVTVHGADDLAEGFAAIARAKAEALLVIEDPIFVPLASNIGDLALKHRLPTMLGDRRFVHAGGLMAYGVVYEDLWRRAAGYVDRILKGADPAEMPIEQPNKLELVINLKTAKALGLTIAPSLMLRADQVIE